MIQGILASYPLLDSELDLTISQTDRLAFGHSLLRAQEDIVTPSQADQMVQQMRQEQSASFREILDQFKTLQSGPRILLN